MLDAPSRLCQAWPDRLGAFQAMSSQKLVRLAQSLNSELGAPIWRFQAKGRLMWRQCRQSVV